MEFNPQAPWLAPARHVWRGLRRIPPVRRFIERRVLYPSLPHIRRSRTYPSGPILIAGFFSSVHGLGEAARLELAALRASGKEAYGIDISPPFGLEDLLPPDGLRTLENAPKHGPLLLHCNAPEAGRVLRYLGPRLTSDRKIIGYWAWELEVLPHDWHLAYKYIDELWVPSHYTARAFANAPVPLKVVPHTVGNIVDGGHSHTDLGLPSSCEHARLFLCMADGRSDLKRKNISGAIKAFGKAVGNNPKVSLIVKLHHLEHAGSERQRIYSLSSAYKNVHIIDAIFSTAQRNSLLHRCDVIISLHRAEGFALLLAEALQIGKKIIATDYSGSTDFLTAENALLIPYNKVPVRGDSPNYVGYPGALWAEPDLQEATRAMANCCSDDRES